MPAFFNQASLTYNNLTTLSNIVQGELVEVLSASKTAASGSYRPGDTVTYAISIVNAGATAYNGLTISDDLGQYTVGAGTANPLTYVADSVRLFVNGVLQPAPTVTGTQPLTITGINVPAGGDAVVLYTALANQFAPVDATGTISNTATIDGAQLTAPITAAADIPVDTTPDLSILKAISSANVVENEPFTYTLTIRNSGLEAIDTTDDVVVADTFDPILDIQTVTLNGVALAEGVGYNYTAATGEFTTLPGVITVPAATVQQDATTGAWTVTPGSSVLAVTGSI